MLNNHQFGNRNQTLNCQLSFFTKSCQHVACLDSSLRWNDDVEILMKSSHEQFKMHISKSDKARIKKIYVAYIGYVRKFF